MLKYLIKNMIKEEARLHSSFNNKFNFISFPIIIALITLGISTLILKYTDITFNINNFAFFSNAIFIILGLLMGIFGLNGTDLLERRFGDMGKLFKNALLLPIELNTIFTSAAISDLVFYLGWFILPFTIGITISLLIAKISIILIPLYLVSIAIAFLTGILFSFCLTVLFTKSQKMFTIILSLITVIITTGIIYFKRKFIPSYYLFTNFGITSLTINIVLTIFLIYAIKVIIGQEYIIVHKNKALKSYNFKKTKAPMFFKDLIDLRRTHGMISKPLFSVIIPSTLLLLLLNSLKEIPLELTSVLTNIVFFAVMIGVLTTGFMNTLLTGDSMTYYNFLPITPRDFVIPKIKITTIIGIITGSLMLIIFAFINNTIRLIIPAIITLIAITMYSNYTNIAINGLRPAKTALNSKNFLIMGTLLLPILLIYMIMPIITYNIIYYILISVLTIGIGKFIFERKITKYKDD
jgi:hypothetical protein